MNKPFYDIETVLAIRHEAEEQRAQYLLSLGRRIIHGIAALLHLGKTGGAVVNQ